MMVAITLWRRDAFSVQDVSATLSSWDNCMAKAYCKWPAIVGIVVGALIVLSLLWCLVRCLCCGMSCCCSCLSCCNSCCPSGRNSSRPHKHRDQPASFPPASYRGYEPAPPPPSYEPPQFARFDVSKNGNFNDDALPPMPSWDTASQRKVPEQHRDEGMEMGRLDPRNAQNVPMPAGSPRTGYTETHSSPLHSPYQRQGGFQEGDLGRPFGHQQIQTACTGSGNPHAYGGSPQQQGYSGYGGGYAQQQRAYSAYSAYTPPSSTAFEPSVNYQQQTGIVYHSTSPPPQYGRSPPVGGSR